MENRHAVITLRHALRLLPALFRSHSAADESLQLIVLRSLLTAQTKRTGLSPEKQVQIDQILAKCTNSLETIVDQQNTQWTAVLKNPKLPLDPLEQPTMTRMEISPLQAAKDACLAAAVPNTEEEIELVDVDFFDLRIIVDIELTDNSAIGPEVPLWPNMGSNAEEHSLEQSAVQMLERFSMDSNFDFWRQWFDSFFRGTQLDADFLVQIALISNSIWEEGPKAVATEIERIRAKLHLETEIERLKSAQSTPILGHNQGPPLDGAETAMRHAFDLVWPILDAIEQEAQKPDPDPEMLEKLALQLWDISKAIAKYCGGLANTVLTKSAETIGETGTKWLIRTGAVTYAGTNEGVQSVANAAWQFAKVLSGG